MSYQIESFDVEKIIPYARNPRKNDHAVDQVAAAIKEFGFRVPMLVKSDGSLVDGHLRLKAAKKLGLETVPVVFCDDMTETQIKAFRLSVNRMAELADWDDELLKLELEDLKFEDIDLDLIGFDDIDIEKEFLKDENYVSGIELKNRTTTEVKNGATAEEKLEKYLLREFLEIKLNYSKQDYQEVVEKLEFLRKKLELESYSDVVKHIAEVKSSYYE